MNETVQRQSESEHEREARFGEQAVPAMFRGRLTPRQSDADTPQGTESKKVDNNTKNLLHSKDLKSKPLHLNEEFQRHAAQHQWRDRRHDGYEWRTDIFEFLQDQYSSWVSQGMTQADLKNVDLQAYKALRKRLDVLKDSFPEDFHIPTKRDAALLRCETDEERAELLAYRSYERKRNEERGLSSPAA